MLDTLREKLSALGAEALLITKPANVRYLSQFRTPEDARVLVTFEDALLLTDGRYTAQAAEESQLPVDIATGNFLD
jgi:Xaa-Pro aminopeptidase